MTQQVDDIRRDIRVRYDDYQDTLFAVIGFVFLYWYDASTQSYRSSVKPFQGRRLRSVTTQGRSRDSDLDAVSPDVGVVVSDSRGVLAEVKKNFPRDDISRKEEIFQQLEDYDHPLIGWPTRNGLIESHDLVLLVHTVTVRYAEDYYRQRVDNSGLRFEQPFAIAEFTRLEQAQNFFFFRYANADAQLQVEPPPASNGSTLREGIAVPQKPIVLEYASHRLYDAEPPMVYLLELLYMNVFSDIAAENERFPDLRRNQRLELRVSVDSTVEQLREGFSFQTWHQEYPEHQPSIPPKSWVVKAYSQLIALQEAEWVEGEEGQELKFWYRRYPDPYQHYVDRLAEYEYDRLTTPVTPRLPGFDEDETGDLNN